MVNVNSSGVPMAFTSQAKVALEPAAPPTSLVTMMAALPFSPLLVYNTPYARRQFYLHPEGECLHGENGLRGSYWGQRAIADHKDELEKFAHDAAKQFLGGSK